MFQYGLLNSTIFFQNIANSPLEIIRIYIMLPLLRWSRGLKRFRRKYFTWAQQYLNIAE